MERQFNTNIRKKNTMKKLKLRIAKFDRMLVVEQLERSGGFCNTNHVKLTHERFFISDFEIRLSERNEPSKADVMIFSGNQERDECAANLINWITEEQFGGNGKLEIGKPCLVGNEQGIWGERIYAGKVAKQLGTDKRFLARVCARGDDFMRWRYAKPLNSAQPKIDGEIYTWEADE